MKATLMFSTGFVAAMLALAPTDATAIHRGSHSMTPEEYDRYCGRLPSYGFDGCGYREFSYGPQGCGRRVIVNTPKGPQAMRVRVCQR